MGGFDLGVFEGAWGQTLPTFGCLVLGFVWPIWAVINFCLFSFGVVGDTDIGLPYGASEQ